MPSTFDETWPRAPFARERGSRAGLYWLTRQVVSRPAPVGKKLRYSECLTTPTIVLGPHRQRSILADERAVAGLRQELCVHECAQQGVTHITIQSPQALGLGSGQPEARHLYEFALNPLQNIIDAHGFLSSLADRLGLAVYTLIKQLAYLAKDSAPRRWPHPLNT